MKNKILHIGILCVAIVYCGQVFGQTHLNVHKINGTKESFVLSTVKKITFASDNMLLSTTSGSNSYALQNIARIDFMVNNDPIVNSTQVPYAAVQLEAAPNPTSGMLHIACGQPMLQLRLLDAYGKVLLASAPKTTTSSISTAHLPAGVYVLQVFTAAGMQGTKIVKN